MGRAGTLSDATCRQDARPVRLIRHAQRKEWSISLKPRQLAHRRSGVKTPAIRTSSEWGENPGNSHIAALSSSNE